MDISLKVGRCPLTPGTGTVGLPNFCSFGLRDDAAGKFVSGANYKYCSIGSSPTVT